MQGIESSQMLLDTYYQTSTKSGGPMVIPWYVTAMLVVILLVLLEQISTFGMSLFVEAATLPPTPFPVEG